MGHEKLLRQGKIDKTEAQALENLKQSNPRTYKFLEERLSERPKGYRRDNPNPYVKQAEEMR